MGEKNKVSRLGMAAVFSVYLCCMGVSVATPAMAALANHFAGMDVSWISTLPTLFIIIGSFVSGRLVGKVVKYRTMTIAACLFYIIGGCAPALFDSYELTLVCRAIFGLGVGFLFPLGSALIIGLFDGQKQATYLGIGSFFMNAGGIIMQLIGGALADVSWQMTFWGHAFCLIGFVMAFFIPEPEKQNQESAGNERSAQDGQKIGRAIWVIALLFTLFNLVNFPTIINTSVLFEIRGAGGATAAAIALSLQTVFGCLAGLVFGKFFQVARRWVLPLSYLVAAAGAACIYFGQTGIIMTVGLALVGLGWNLIIPCLTSWAGSIAPANKVAVATSICMACLNLGAFLSSLWLGLLTSIFGESMYSDIIIEIGLFVVLAVVFVFFNPLKNAVASNDAEIDKAA